MIKKSNIGSTGVNRVRVPHKMNPFRSSGNYSQYRMVITEKEKEDNNYELIKKLVIQYEELGRRNISSNKGKVIKNHNLANGIIDQNDYIRSTSEEAASLELLDNQDIEVDLEFYPLIPKIVNTLTSFLSKSKVSYSAIAVNREAQNEILEKKNGEIQELLVSQAKVFFDNDMLSKGVDAQTQPDIYQQQLEIFQKLPKIQKYYNTDFRLEVENWANHKIESTKRKFNFLEIEKKLFRNRIICDRPFLHINLMGDTMKPEVLRAENCAFLRSPYTEDVSEGYMFMWYEYDSPVNLIQRVGDKLSADNIEKLSQRFMPTRFTVANQSNTEFNTSKPVEADVQNYLAFRSERDSIDRKYRGDEFRDNLIEVLNMYIQIPRKIFKLTIMSPDGSVATSLVDENYKPVFKPQYILGKGKTVDALLEGEHMDPIYINELWRVMKLNFSRNANPKLNEDVWVVLEKYPLQLSNPKVGKFGSYIPVHGGPTTNEYSPSSQIVDKAASWQILYNYLWNRISQIMEVEIGPFLLMNQNAIPSESMGESWGKNNLLKFYLTARDMGIGALDTSPGNMGGANPLSGSFGQKVDMSRGSEVLEKAQLAEIIKQECFSVIGISPQFMAEISPNETATGITQGIQRSITAVKGLYDDHYVMMERAWQTILEVSKYISISQGSVEETYINSEGERQIFQTSAADFPLYDMGVYTSASFDDTLLLAELQDMVKRDNTLGADVAEKIAMMTATSIGEIHSRLKDFQEKKSQTIQQQQQAEAQQTQAKIEADARNQAVELEWEKAKLLMTLESNEHIQEMKVVGQSQLAQGNGVEELLKLQQSGLNEKQYYQDLIEKARTNQDRKAELSSNAGESAIDRQHSASIERDKLQVKREEILARLKIAKTQLDIAKENKPTKINK